LKAGPIQPLTCALAHSGPCSGIREHHPNKRLSCRSATRVLDCARLLFQCGAMLRLDRAVPLDRNSRYRPFQCVRAQSTPVRLPLVQEQTSECRDLDERRLSGNAEAVNSRDRRETTGSNAPTASPFEADLAGPRRVGTRSNGNVRFPASLARKRSDCFRPNSVPTARSSAQLSCPGADALRAPKRVTIGRGMRPSDYVRPIYRASRPSLGRAGGSRNVSEQHQ
jgi:hypothetical protein